MSLKVKNIFYTYSKGTPFEKDALFDVSFEVEDGEYVGIIGHTGSGKSTLIQTLNGLLKVEFGQIFIDGELMDRNSAAKMRAKIGLIFQYPEDQLFEETVYKDIAFGLKKSALSESDKDFKIREAAKIVELDENLLDKSIYELSGGQKRKAAIAGVVVMEPGILILDEPAAGLDPAGRNEILNFTKRLRDEKGVSVILVSHSMEDIAAIADKVIVMNKGRIEMQGHPRDIFHHRERLEEIGLTIPQISKLFGELGKYVPGLFSDVLTVDEALNSIISYTGGCHY